MKMKPNKAQKCKSKEHDFFEIKEYFYIDITGFRVKVVKYECEKCGYKITRKYW